VEEYDQQSLFPMLLKCYHIYHVMVEFVAYMQIDKKIAWTFLKCLLKQVSQQKEVVNKELHMFIRFQVDVKDIKCPLEWWAKHESLFPTVVIFTCHIFSIIGSQIESENLFSLVGIFTNLKRCHLQLDNSNKVFFVSKN